MSRHVAWSAVTVKNRREPGHRGYVSSGNRCNSICKSWQLGARKFIQPVGVRGGKGRLQGKWKSRLPAKERDGLGDLGENAARAAPGNKRYQGICLEPIFGQSFQIAQSLNQSPWRDACDLVIEPDTTDYKWDDFARAEELIAAGERAARQVLPSLQALLEPRPGSRLVAAR